jgi:nitrite reductase (NO-forming)
MYGQILVEPRAGLPPVDREYQIVQSEFYTEGKFGEPGAQRFSMEKALSEDPDYVVFNGRVGALTGQHALRAKVGERVRVYFGNAGPSLVSSFHVSGEIFDSVYGEGGTLANQRDVRTTIVPAGGSAVLEFTLDVPGEYALVDHSLFRSSRKGTVGSLSVEGKDNRLLFSGTTSYARYAPGTELTKSAAFLEKPSGDPGAEVFATVCATCHQPTGEGLAKVFPPLADSDFLMADEERAIRIVMSGLKGPIRVNGEVYDSEMPNPHLSDEQIARVLSYVQQNFGNRGGAVSVEDVARVRAAQRGTEGPLVAEPSWTRGAPKSARPRTRPSKAKAKSKKAG